ncbi:hypothetical protein ABW21_db0203048 [Orbilia brochopaga]|nr:hypothetical protein ABW21_db0203048 [Drechslerella brochopaga]
MPLAPRWKRRSGSASSRFSGFVVYFSDAGLSSAGELCISIYKYVHVNITTLSITPQPLPPRLSPWRFRKQAPRRRIQIHHRLSDFLDLTVSIQSPECLVAFIAGIWWYCGGGCVWRVWRVYRDSMRARAHHVCI